MGDLAQSRLHPSWRDRHQRRSCCRGSMRPGPVWAWGIGRGSGARSPFTGAGREETGCEHGVERRPCRRGRFRSTIERRLPPICSMTTQSANRHNSPHTLWRHLLPALPVRKRKSQRSDRAPGENATVTPGPANANCVGRPSLPRLSLGAGNAIRIMTHAAALQPCPCAETDCRETKPWSPQRRAPHPPRNGIERPSTNQPVDADRIRETVPGAQDLCPSRQSECGDFGNLGPGGLLRAGSRIRRHLQRGRYGHCGVAGRTEAHGWRTAPSTEPPASTSCSISMTTRCSLNSLIRCAVS